MFADLDVRVTEQLETLLICLSEGVYYTGAPVHIPRLSLSNQDRSIGSSKDQGVLGLVEWESDPRQLHRI